MDTRIKVRFPRFYEAIRILGEKIEKTPLPTVYWPRIIDYQEIEEVLATMPDEEFIDFVNGNLPKFYKEETSPIATVDLFLDCVGYSELKHLFYYRGGKRD